MSNTTLSWPDRLFSRPTSRRLHLCSQGNLPVQEHYTLHQVDHQLWPQSPLQVLEQDTAHHHLITTLPGTPPALASEFPTNDTGLGKSDFEDRQIASLDYFMIGFMLS